jgi:hypothetical protein
MSSFFLVLATYNGLEMFFLVVLKVILHRVHDQRFRRE